MKKLVFLFILLLTTLRSSGAADAEFSSVNDVLGFPNRQLFSVTCDANGFIWTCSKSGAVRLTSSEYRHYTFPYVKSDIITTKLLMVGRYLWAYTNTGQLMRYNELLDKFEMVIDIDEVLSGKRFYGMGDMISDGRQQLWLSTSVGLYRFDTRTRELHFADEDTVEVDGSCFVDDHRLVVAKVDGIWLYDLTGGGRRCLHRYGDNDRLTFRTLYYDSHRRQLWLGSRANGLYTLKLNEGPLRKLPGVDTNKAVMSIREYDDTLLYIGVDGDGVYAVDKSTQTVRHHYLEDIDQPNSLRGNGVYDIYCHVPEQTVLVATFNGGLSALNLRQSDFELFAHQIRNPQSLNNNHVNKMIEDTAGDLWFATDNGVSRYRSATGQWDTYYKDYGGSALVFLSIAQGPDGNIWCASYSAGFFVIDRVTGRQIHHYYRTDLASLSGKYFYEFAPDRQGNMWIAGLGDLIRYDARTREFKRINDLHVISICEFDEERMAIGCLYSTVLVNKQTGKLDYVDKSLAQDVCTIGDDLWIASTGNGLLRCRLKTGQVDTFTVADGLPNNFVNNVFAQGDTLWIGTEEGLCRLISSKLDHDGHIVHSQKDLHIECFNFASVQPGMALGYNSISRTSDGRLLFGTNQGGVRLDPTALFEQERKGRFYIQDISVSGVSVRRLPDLLSGTTPVDSLSHLTFTARQNTLSIEMIPLEVMGQDTRMQWMMEGLDEEWTLPARQQIISYSNLPAGDYTLKVRLLDSTLTHLLSERKLSITIEPLFYNTWWFRLLMACSFIGLAVAAFYWYINRLKYRHAEDKIDFFTRVAHDIRTSFTLISGPITELNKETRLSANGRYYLSLAMQQVKGLSDVATQLLDFQKLDAGRGQFFPEQTDVPLLLQERAEMFREVARGKQITISSTACPASYLTALDRVKIQKVLDNLLSNALKYAPVGTSVELSFEGRAQDYVIRVRDYGPGISAHDRKHLFRTFYRGRDNGNAHIIGTGVGLIIVKDYVEMHGGTVRVESEVGQGACFVLTLPRKELTQEMQDEKLTQEMRDEKQDEMQKQMQDEMQKEAVQKTAADTAGATATVQTPAEEAAGISPLGLTDADKADAPVGRNLVLVVDDTPEMLEFLRRSLSDRFEVATAADGLEALHWIEAHPDDHLPDLILSDVMMPRMDGFELCRCVKSSATTAHIPFVMLTALTDEQNQLTAFGLGADIYIGKPFDVAILLERVTAVIRHRNAVVSRLMQSIRQQASSATAVAGTAASVSAAGDAGTSAVETAGIPVVETAESSVIADAGTSMAADAGTSAVADAGTSAAEAAEASAAVKPDVSAEMDNPFNDAFLRKAIAVVEANISNPDFDKEVFADAMKLSSSMLYKKLKALIGQGSTEFIKCARMNRAMTLLITHNYSVTEVSERCGYSSLSYFSTVFKKHFDRSPGDI